MLSIRVGVTFWLLHFLERGCDGMYFALFCVTCMCFPEEHHTANCMVYFRFPASGTLGKDLPRGQGEQDVKGTSQWK